MRLLIVEDEKKISDSLVEALGRSGHHSEVIDNGSDVEQALNRSLYDLIILDWMLPGKSGVEVLQDMRRRKQNYPVIMLTAKDEIEDRVLGLDSGADDYLVKPFAMVELLARVRRFERNLTAQSEQYFYQLETLRIKVLERKVFLDENEVELTQKEFDILHYLFQHQGQIVSRHMLSKDVWKIQDRATPLDNVIDVHMTKLRKKIKGKGAEEFIETIRGIGFKLRTE